MDDSYSELISAPDAFSPPLFLDKKAVLFANELTSYHPSLKALNEAIQKLKDLQEDHSSN